MSLTKLFELNEMAKKTATKYPLKRFIYSELKKRKGRIFISLIGPRGVGKTVLLRQLAIENENSFYLSMDTFEEGSFFELAKILSEKYKIKLLLIDEIHFLKNYQYELKKIFDFLDINLIFTSSVAISLYESSYDLSRRVKIVKIYPFSFREYIYFKEGKDLAPLTIEDIFNSKYTSEHLKFGYLFEEYLKGGIFPFSLENYDFMDAIKNILKKIISSDIPIFAGIKMDEINLIEKTFKFISISPGEDINYSSVSRNIGITKHKAEQYLNILERAFLVNLIMPYGTNVLKEPKVLLYLPFRLINKEYSQCIGALREDFAVESLKMRGYDIFYLKSKRGEKTPDFFIKEKDKKFVIEVGGKGKGRQQFKDFRDFDKITFVDADVVNSNFKKPLFLLGYF